MAKRENRFIKIHSDSTWADYNEIWVDKETGVNYFWHHSGHAGGLTVLLNADGTPVITPKSQLTED